MCVVTRCRGEVCVCLVTRGRGEMYVCVCGDSVLGVRCVCV